MSYRLWAGTVGDDFEPGVWDALQAAANYCMKQGNRITIAPEANKCLTPYHGLAMMRNTIIVEGLLNGASHVLLTDTDILFDDETALHAMVLADKPAIVPAYNQSLWAEEFGFHRLQNPMHLETKDVTRLDWAIMSCVLFNADVFRQGVDPRLFSDHLAAAEERYYWLYLNLHGVQCHQANEAKVTMLRPPMDMWDMGNARVETEQIGTDINFHFKAKKRD